MAKQRDHSDHKRLKEIRVSCSAPRSTASDDLERRIKQLGFNPIVTPVLVRAVYQGTSRVVAETLMEIFELEQDHEITLDDPSKPRSSR